MTDQSDNNRRQGIEKTGWLRGTLVLLSVILLAVVITVVLYLFRDKVVQLGNYGYLGAFLISLVSSATVIVPVPGIVVLIALAAPPASLNPVLVGLAGSTGGIIGEMTGFMVGYGGQKVMHGRSRLYTRLEGWMRRWGSWALFAFAAAPVPLFDVAGIVAGALHFPLWKFLLVGWVGKSIKLTLLVMAGAWGWSAALRLFGQ